MSFDLPEWLIDIGLPQYLELFLSQGFDGPGLASLTDADLRELGIAAMGHRKTILREAASLALPQTLVPGKLVDPQTIFLSYAHKSEREEDFDVSEELVLLIKAELDKDGHRVWIDKEGIRSGFEWRERITSAILEHTHFLSFLSRRSVRDPGVCLNEIATALGHTRNIQTVLAGPESQVSPPLTISHLQWHDFQDWREIHAGTKTGANGEGWDAWFSQRMELVRDTVGNGQNAQASGQLQRLKDILVPSGFEARIIQKTEGFFGRQWLFDATQDWLDNSTSRMFWLKASPGIGKSAFAAKLTHQARSAVIGFFMCDFQGMKNPEDSAREAICTLAFQMASRLPDYRSKLIYQQQVDKEKILKKSADDLFEYLITEPLNKSGKIPEATRLCLVIDGLDEAGRGNGNNALADLLVKHVNRLPEWLGVVVTSRPEPYLEQILKPLSGISVDGQTQQNQQDLVAWIEEKLPERLEGEERQRVIDVVLEKSGGTFLYLRLVEEDKTLDISQPESLPDKLDGIFKQNFNRYFPDAQEYGNKTEPFLRLLVAAPGPLPEQMGRQILGWSPRDLTLNVTEPMGSLLQQRDGGLVFFHASLSDWLKDPKRSGTHCVNDTGGKELGEFVWQQFEDFENSQCQEQVVQWLATLMQYTDHWREVKDLNRVAGFLGQNLRHRDAISVRQRELALIVQTVGSESEDAGNCMNELAKVFFQAGEYKISLPIFQNVLAIREKALGQEDLAVAISQNNLGLTMATLGSLDSAHQLYLRSLGVVEKVLGPDHPDVAISLNNIANLLSDQLEHTKALKFHERALKIRETALGFDSKDTATSMNNLACVYRDLEDFESSRSLFERALAKYERLLGSHHPLTANTILNLAGVLQRLGKFELAKQLTERAIKIHEKNDGTFHPDFARCISLMAWILYSVGDYENSRLFYERAYIIFENSLGPSHPWTANNLNQRAVLLFALGDYQTAFRLCEGALAIREKVLGFDHPDTAESYATLSEICQGQGDLPAALACSGNSLRIRERLANRDPSNMGWLRDLGEAYTHNGEIFKTEGQGIAAKAECLKGLNIFVQLIKPDDAGSLIDHAAGLASLASCHSALGEMDLALELDLQIAAIDWKSDAIVGAFRKNSIPNIVARLDGIFDQCAPELQARVARRCLAGLEAVGIADIDLWRARAAQKF